jgi:FkbM family methyltransferase
MNLRNIRYGRFNSSLARTILMPFFRPGKPYRLWFGPLRGRQMYYDRSINFHAILGLWDTETFELLNRIFVDGGLLSKNSTVADVGANIGYYTMWLSTVMAGSGHVYAFEPSLDVLKFLSSNLKINNIGNADVVRMACGDHVGNADFFIAKHHHASSLHADWAGGGQGDARKITVPMTTLDVFFSPDTGRLPPNFIKIDIEGGGTYALPGCRRILQDARPFILIESHTPDEDRAISTVLNEHRYKAYRLNDRRWVQKPGAVHPDLAGVWGTLLLTPEEYYERVAAAIEGRGSGNSSLNRHA